MSKSGDPKLAAFNDPRRRKDLVSYILSHGITGSALGGLGTGARAGYQRSQDPDIQAALKIHKVVPSSELRDAVIRNVGGEAIKGTLPGLAWGGAIGGSLGVLRYLLNRAGI
jgi:hypothetical protein